MLHHSKGIVFTVWKNVNSLTEKIFREINCLVTSLIFKISTYVPMDNWKFREGNVFTKEVRK